MNKSEIGSSAEKESVIKTAKKLAACYSSRGISLGAFFAITALNSYAATVTISSPANGSVVSSPVALSALTTGAIPQSILVYDNGSLILRQRGVSTLSSALTLSAGSHTILVEATESRGQPVTASATITVSGAGSSPALGTGAEIAGDMTGPNEGHPHGVPLSWDWANGSAVEMGNNSKGWAAMTAWGVIYVAAQGNPATNTRVNIRDMQAWFLQKSTGKWLMLQNTSTPDGAAYLEDFSGDTSKTADLRKEPDGSISVTAGGGYNFHFYPSARAAINPNDIGGIVTIFQARLILGSPSGTDDRSIANYLAGAGGDYYPALTGGWPGNLSYNPGIALGKQKYVKNDWRFYAMTTMTAISCKRIRRR